MRNPMRLLAAVALSVGVVGVGAQGAAAAAPAQAAQTHVVWTRSANPINLWFEAFPGGFVGASSSCWDETPPTVYTSRDGIKWTTPPDRRIFATSDEGFCINGYGPAHGPAGYLVAGHLTDGVTTIWQSSDGIRWTRTAVPSFDGADILRIAPTRTGYLAEDSSQDNYWTSTDGMDWTPAASDAFKLELGQPGVPMLAGGEGGFSWFSLDGGRTWGETVTPKGQKLLEGVARLGKVYYGDWEYGGYFKIYSTRDMRHWAPVKGPGTSPAWIVAFGNRLYVVDSGNTLTGNVYSSADGRTWTRVKDPAGHAMQANYLQVVGGRLFVFDDAGAIIWVGSLG